MSISVGMAMIVAGSKKITQEELNEVLKQHALWLENKETGKCADLSGYDLEEMDFSGINLSNANLDGAFCFKTKMVGTNLTGVTAQGADFTNVDLTDAILDKANMEGTHLCHSKLLRVHAEDARFEKCVMWENDYSGAVMKWSSFRLAQLCDGNFTEADLSCCNLFLADIDYADFTDANLEFANLIWTKNCYWATFTGANLKNAFLDDCEFSDEKIEGVKGLDIHMVCPEEGAFIAWWKSRDNKLVKLLIPEHANRTGGYREWCRASEALILEIYDGDNTCNETTGFRGDDKVYRKGETVKAEKFDGSLYHGGEGIEFRLSKAEAETIKYKEKEEQEDDE